MDFASTKNKCYLVLPVNIVKIGGAKQKSLVIFEWALLVVMKRKYLRARMSEGIIILIHGLGLT